MARFKVKKTGETFTIYRGRRPVLTPAGRPFAATDERLATLVCEDMCRFGPEPISSVSYVTLHASTTDFGAEVPRARIEESVISGYHPGWDIALMQISAFDDRASSPSLLLGDDGPAIEIDPRMLFGPPVEDSVIRAWLSDISLRALFSVQVCGKAIHSILVPYRLLNPERLTTTAGLARGIVAFRDALHHHLAGRDGSLTPEEKTQVLLNKGVTYASSSDEPPGS